MMQLIDQRADSRWSVRCRFPTPRLPIGLADWLTVVVGDSVCLDVHRNTTSTSICTAVGRLDLVPPRKGPFVGDAP